ncbi:MAG: hypothetical protein WD468_00465 [Pirellulales bacterium]
MNQNYRNNDPSTSTLAGLDIEASGTAHKQRSRCLVAVVAMPGLTARELEAHIGIKAHKRLPELREAGLVRNGPTRLCTVSGRQALTWDPDGYSFAAGHREHPRDIPSTPYTGACA